MVLFDNMEYNSYILKANQTKIQDHKHFPFQMLYITHPNGQKTYYEDDNFTDPWKPCEIIVI